MPRVYTRRPLAERFAEKVRPATDLSPNGMAGCLLWTAATRHGYGVISAGGREPHLYAHRVAWMLAGRTVPPGLDLDHLCRRRHCVNADHLESVTRAENLRRGAGTRLTAEQVDEIRYLAHAGWYVPGIAAAYGVKKAHVYNIKNGQRWANV